MQQIFYIFAFYYIRKLYYCTRKIDFIIAVASYLYGKYSPKAFQIDSDGRLISDKSSNKWTVWPNSLRLTNIVKRTTALLL